MSDEEKKKPIYMSIIGVNLMIVVAYTVLLRVMGDAGLILAAFLIAAHFIGSLITAAFAQKWEWVLSAFMVLIVGFFTCSGLAGTL